MNKRKLQNRLVMKPLELKHLSQFNDLLRYVFQVTNRELNDSGWEQDEIVQSKRPVLQKADVIGWFNKEKLVSQLAVYPMRVNIHGEIYEMGGITGVATYPEYSNYGLMHSLMKQSLKDMRSRKQIVSYLFPYSIPYYRRKGWEIISDVMSFTIKDTQLPKIIEVPGMVERVELDHDDLKDTHNRFTQHRHGALVRDHLAWEEYWRWEVEDIIAAIYYDEHHVPQGYITYWISDDIFYMKEMVYLNEEARKGIWNYVSAHFSMITDVKGKTYTNESLAFLLEDSEIEEMIKPFFMARIVDVEAFIKKFPFTHKEAKNKFTFVVDDPLLEWNTGNFAVSWDEAGNTCVSKEIIGDTIKLDIRTLTTMLFSYRRPTYLGRIGRVNAKPETIKLLETLIPLEQPYFSDYF
ncbi:MAG: enhanced intracellular survival protein Eis [Cellulosilyticaceae bacterium]